MKEQRPILVFFTGSDWCAPCKAFKKDVLRTDVFLNAVKNEWVLVEVDLPRDKSIISAEALKQNKLLQDYFEIVSFPTALVLSADGSPLGNASRYRKPEDFLVNLNPYLETNKKFTQHINDASKLEGKPKAQAMTNALNLVAKDRVRFHTESVNTLRELDGKGDAEVAKLLLKGLIDNKKSMDDDIKSLSD